MKGLTRYLLTAGLMLSTVGKPTINSSAPSYFSELTPKQISYGNDIESFNEQTTYLMENSKKEEKKNLFGLPAKYIGKTQIMEILKKYHKYLPPEFSANDIAKIIMKESSFNVNAYREDKRKDKKTKEVDIIPQLGLMQLTDETYYGFEKEIPFEEGARDPEKNILIGLKNFGVIRNYLKKNNPNWENSDLEYKQKALIAGHNWGIGSLKKVDFDTDKVPTITKKFFDYFYDNN
ncbi:MAG: transglycosylase SLT domain-containing protein [Nanoarchaeota archaeon]|nr:transglycosylase SLT domain-containing protein [Nanoarchaeota archaeon]